MCTEAGILGYKSNHLLSATTETCGIEMARTGHGSLASLQSYQHPSERLKEIVSDINEGTRNSTEDDINSSLRCRRKSSTAEESDKSKNKVCDIAISCYPRLSFEIAKSSLTTPNEILNGCGCKLSAFFFE